MNTDDRFLILALPRSRTAWLSHFLSYGDWYCGHEQIRYMRTLEDVKSWLSMERTGSCETGVAPFWRLIAKYAPGIRIVTIRRPVEEVVESLARQGMGNIDLLREAMTRLDHKLDQIQGRLTNVKSVQFSDLADELVCGEVFEFCLPYRHDSAWWQMLSNQNIQINFPALRRYVAANLPAIEKLGSMARQAMFMEMAVRPVAGQSIIISEEPIEDVLRDCQDLFRQHCVEVGESPGNWMNKNLPLMRKLYHSGAMQCMVARCNGRAFGYLTTFISPTLEAEDRMVAQHATFYTSREIPGLGLKLQRAALAALKQKGISEVFMRSGIRGSGDRLGIIYKRLGAEDFGQMHRVALEA